jgi:hypothetical protein
MERAPGPGDVLPDLKLLTPDSEQVALSDLVTRRFLVDQARRLRDGGVPFPCLLDPERNLYRALGLEHIRWYRFLQPRTWRRYLASARRARPGRPTGDVRQSPGVAIVDADLRIRYVHRGETLGDYPRLDDVIEALRTV